MNEQQILEQIRNTPQMMQNETVANVFNLMEKNDHYGLVNLYKQTCQTMGVQPNPQFLQ